MFSTTVLKIISLGLVVGGAVGAANLGLETNDVADHMLSTSINFIFDMFLKHYANKLIEEGKTSIRVDDFERRFSTNFLSLDIEGAIDVSQGWCSNISTIHRTGDADMDRVNEEIVLTAHLGLEKLDIVYNYYDVSLLGAHQKGKIFVAIGENSLWLRLRVRVKPSCLITLDDLKIEKLDDISVDITNLGIFQNLTDEITSWVINEVTKWYRSYVEQTVFPELSKAVLDADLCHYLPI